MPPRHKYMKCLCQIPASFLIMGLCHGVIMKNKMCLLYEFNNYVSNGTAVIASYDGTTKPQCMSSCVHSNSCAAFHFHSNDGKCDLLGTTGGCMSYIFRMSTIFVQLTKCEGTAPWRVMSQTLKTLQWRHPAVIGDREVVRADAERYIARILYQGIFLTGFMKDKTNQLFVVDMNGIRIHCSLFIEVLTCVNSTNYSWLEYELGESIPASAVIGGFGQDGTPLYVVSVHLIDWKPGYYSDCTKQLFVKGLKEVSTMKAVRMLVENWYDLYKFK